MGHLGDCLCGVGPLTAVFAKIGIEGVNSDLATLIRTAVVLVVLSVFVVATGKWSDPTALSQRTWLFLVLSALATECLLGLLLSRVAGRTRLASCSYRQAESAAGRSVCICVSQSTTISTRMGWHRASRCGCADTGAETLNK